MPLVLPNARVGISQLIGVMMTPEGKPGIEVYAMGGLVIAHIYKYTKQPDGSVHSEKFYTLQIPPVSTERLASVLDKAAKVAKGQQATGSHGTGNGRKADASAH